MWGAALIVGALASACSLPFEAQRFEQQCSTRGLVTRARTFDLPEPLACGATAGRCLAVAWPHLFVGTTKSLVAVDLEARTVPQAVDFVPADPLLPWFVRGVAVSESSVWITAAPEGDANAPDGGTLPVLVASTVAPRARAAVAPADQRIVLAAGNTRNVGVYAAPAG